MAKSESRTISCECGLPVNLPKPGKRTTRVVACRCGRLIDLEIAGARWTTVSVLTPEGSVPITGFSESLRQEPDVERFWFRQSLPLEGTLMVHVVFVPSTGEAEVKAGDQKAIRLRKVRSAAEARRRWLALRRAPVASSQASRRLLRHSRAPEAED